MQAETLLPGEKSPALHAAAMPGWCLKTALGQGPGNPRAPFDSALREPASPAPAGQIQTKHGHRCHKNRRGLSSCPNPSCREAPSPRGLSHYPHPRARARPQTLPEIPVLLSLLAKRRGLSSCPNPSHRRSRFRPPLRRGLSSYPQSSAPTLPNELPESPVPQTAAPPPVPFPPSFANSSSPAPALTPPPQSA